MKKYSIFLLLLALTTTGFSQSYEFETVIDLDALDVINQGNTGTCWSFSTSSFLESEITRTTGKKIDLSEMYTVRQTYPVKSWNYVMRQGKAQFSEGGLAHDVINSMNVYGLVPEEAYTGLLKKEKTHDHSELVGELQPILDNYIKNPKSYDGDWQADVSDVLDDKLGDNIQNFTYGSVSYTPLSFLEMTGLQADNYVTITSFTHQPYNTSFILDIPDNFSNGSFYNVELDDLVDITNDALKAGFTVELDCDVSEETFSSKYGIAVIPKDVKDNKAALKSIKKELKITEAYRQEEFENFDTTDDHLMHIVGLVEDQKGNTYYKVKNSWGGNSDRISNDGYIYMSEAYFKLKTISIMVHKDALPRSIQKDLKL
ncbi:C1 family peptidase [Formosa sp. PL04]|uniref:C1 family peptidase n=1 Tax=Formosa sp. PL04 TaxID=3081755 RepID=UPI002981527D|nr:C1 family peptidase [Formosa sp. PL04]MDW5289583.1 C1 family peptidase [Formosa sp. PL04]